MTIGLPAQSEKGFQAQVEQLAKLHRWRCYHTRFSMRSAAGFPDLVLVRGPRLIFAELKAEGQEPTAAQEAWLAALRRVPGCEVHVWRPGDWQSIVATLQGDPGEA
jgi:hypothetical protein